MNSIQDRLNHFLDYKIEKEERLKCIRLSKYAKKLEFIKLYVDKNGDVFQIEDENSRLGFKLMKATYKNKAFVKIPKTNVYTLIEYILSKQDTPLIQGFIHHDNIDMTFWIKGCHDDIARMCAI